MTGGRRTPGPGVGAAAESPRTLDAAVREVVQLLGVVAEEEQALARLDRCVDDLRRIATARAALARSTDSELAEAQFWTRRAADDGLLPILPAEVTGEVL